MGGQLADLISNRQLPESFQLSQILTVFFHRQIDIMQTVNRHDILEQSNYVQNSTRPGQSAMTIRIVRLGCDSSQKSLQ